MQRTTNETTGAATSKISAPLPTGLASDLSKLTTASLNAILTQKENNGTLLGSHPEDGREVRLMLGRYGAYLMLGKAGEEGTRTQTLPKKFGGMGGEIFSDFGEIGDGDGDGDSTDKVPLLSKMIGLTFEDAISYLNMPTTVGEYEGIKIENGVGRYGPYLKWNGTFVSLRDEIDVLTVGKCMCVCVCLCACVSECVSERDEQASWMSALNAQIAWL